MTFNNFWVTLLETIYVQPFKVQELSSEAILGGHNIAFQGIVTLLCYYLKTWMISN